MHKGTIEGEAQSDGFESPRNTQMEFDEDTYVVGCGPVSSRSCGEAAKTVIGLPTSSGHSENMREVSGNDKNDRYNPPKTRPIKAGCKKPTVKVGGIGGKSSGVDIGKNDREERMEDSGQLSATKGLGILDADQIQKDQL
ncbi:hypothetical protein Ancab_001994 [Ancistrocladus abbreviatus]